jgi:LCP family protein required for cell wall assembly
VIMVTLAGVLSALVLVLWGLRVFKGLPQSQQVFDGIKQYLPAIAGPDRIVLVMGVDHNQAGGLSRRRALPADDAERQQALFTGARTDTMLLVRFGPARRTLSIVSLPRDSKVFYNNNSQVGKLNGAFAMGGLQSAKSVVETSFGVPVDHVIVIHLEGIKTLIDTLGGLELTLPKALRYTDHADGLRIRLNEGTQRLNGDDAVAYLRFRNDALADIGRIRRQHYFLTSLKQRLMQPSTLLKVPELISRLRPYLLTDMDDGQLINLANVARTVPPSGIRVATLPGKASSTEAVSYWIIEPYAAKQLLNRLMFNTDSTESTLRGSEPLRLGVLYGSEAEPWLTSLSEALAESTQFTLSCKKRLRQPSQAVVIEQSLRLRDDDTLHLTKLVPVLTELPIVVAPHNTTYEVMGCSPSDDMTLVIPDSLVPRLSVATPHEPSPLPKPGTSYRIAQSR